jgi:benzoate-CoA ligase
VSTREDNPSSARSPSGFELFNAADDLLLHNLAAGRGDRVAVIDRNGSYSYSELVQRVNRFANLLTHRGIEIEQRILICLFDTIDFHTCFLGAIKAGAVPVPVNTLLNADDYGYLLEDTRARMVVFSEEFRPVFEPLLENHPFLHTALVSGATAGAGCERLADAVDGMSDRIETAPTRPDDTALWLYTSGTTGKPKGVIHSQTDMRATADHFAAEILEINEDDLIFSAPKLFFAYGLGNALVFPLSVGATTLLLDGRPTAESVTSMLDTHRPSLFFSVPTLYSMMLNTGNLPDPHVLRLRACISAGEALPEAVLSRWREEVGLDIIDAIGSTEMLHMYMSNRPGDIRPGSSGKPLSGYEVRLLDDNGQAVADGDIGDLYVAGPSSGTGYWNQHAKSVETFQGRWTRTGDKYYVDDDGYYVNCGRSDDLIKVGGIYVSPLQVENALLGHRAVNEVAVVGAGDNDQLVKPKAFVVLADGAEPSEQLQEELIEFVRDQLSPYKRPRWIEFVSDLPKTATGKIQRFKLR